MSKATGVSPADIKTTVVQATYTTTIDVPYAQLLKLVEEAMGAKGRAYCPYSRFRVGCAVLTESGAIITGVNVENASYPVGTCAERCAIGRAVAEGHRRIVALAVATDSTPGGIMLPISIPFSYVLLISLTPDKIKAKTYGVYEIASPCGMCRQFIREFAALSIPVILLSKEGQPSYTTLEQLLPMSFGPDDLNGHRRAQQQSAAPRPPETNIGK